MKHLGLIIFLSGLWLVSILVALYIGASLGYKWGLKDKKQSAEDSYNKMKVDMLSKMPSHKP